MRSSPPNTFMTTTLAVILALALVAASCSGDGESADVAATTTTEAPVDVAESAASVDEDIDVEDVVRARDAVMPEPEEIQAIARTYCEAWGGPRDVAAIGATLTDDVVLYDGVTGDRYEGAEEAGTYIANTMIEFDNSDCGPAAVGGDWVAITYTLSSSETGEGVEGIAAIRVLDDKIAWHLAFYTPTDAANPPDEGSLRDDMTAALAYCEAFATISRDPDVILATMTAEPEIHGIPQDFAAVGADAVRDMIETQFVPSDVNTCGDSATLDHSAWQAGPSSTVNRHVGIWLEGVNVIEVVDGKVNRHYVQITFFDGAEAFADENWGVAD